VNTKTIELDLETYDTPGLRRYTIKGDCVIPSRIIVKNNRLIMLVNICGESDNEHDLRVEVHGTGWPIPNAENIKYAGTGVIAGGRYVWHVFYSFAKKDEATKNSNNDDMRIFTIFKYPIADSGTTTISFDHKFVMPLHVGLQNGELMLWVLFEVVSTLQESTRVFVAVDDGELIDGAKLVVRLNYLKST
jgi:hypothetical protein